MLDEILKYAKVCKIAKSRNSNYRNKRLNNDDAVRPKTSNMNLHLDRYSLYPKLTIYKVYSRGNCYIRISLSAT